MTGLLWWHKVGQLVVCIDASPTPNPMHPPLVLKGVYDIGDVLVGDDGYVFLGMAQHWRRLAFRDGSIGSYPLFEHERFKPVARTSIDTMLDVSAPIDSEKVVA